MRIAYVINSVEGGGAATPVPAIVRTLQAEGAVVRVFALTPRDRRGLPAMLDAGLDVRVRSGGDTDHWPAFRWLDAALDDWQPSHIWTSLTRATLLGQLAGLKRRRPVISWQHAAYLKPANRRLLRATQPLSRLWIGDSECVTDLTAKRLAVPPSRLACWPIFAADPGAPQSQPWRPGQIVRIGSLGRLHPVKGYDVLIAALAILKSADFRPAAPFEVAIGGEGLERGALEAAIADAGLGNVRLAGFVERPGHFLGGRHLYLQPSRSEGFGIAAHEAMQAGVGVIASAVGELQHSIDQSCGLTVAADDPQALARALAHLLSYPEMLAGLGEAARRRVLLRFGPVAFAERGRAILDRINSF
jgi:glycosyltransferase involved in cell wall biosynthesis